MTKTRVITVSASRAGAGKTSLIEKLIPILGDCAAVKAHVSETDESKIIEEENPDESPGKDTSRYLAAGARRAFLVHGPLRSAIDAVTRIIDSGEFAVVAVESNAVARALDADLAFFVEAPGEEKPGAALCRSRADIIVLSGAVIQMKGAAMPDESPDAVIDALKAAAKDGRITCREALELACRLNVSPSLVGKAANEAKIKIKSCQLGFF